MTTTEPSTEHLDPHRAMYAWNPTWKHRNIPRWAQKPMRAYIKWRKACNDDRFYEDLPYWIETNFRDIVDHWGSIEDSTGQRVLIMCPYGPNPEIAAKLAEIINAQSWTCTPSGPWHPKTFLYIFKP